MLGGKTVLACIMAVQVIQSPVAANFFRRMAEQAGGSTPWCYIENGYDYPGNDIKNVPGATADVCCGECTKVSGCGAWTWNGYGNGTCWLKSSRGNTIVPTPYAKSSLVFQGPMPVCEILENVDFVGNDIAKAASSKVEGCCDICHNYSGCRAYSWTDYQGGTCWLKSGKGQAIVKAGVKAATAYPAQKEPLCALETDVDYVGNDIGSAPSPYAGGCCAICQKTTKCRAYSWTNQNGGTCWLKNLKGDTVKKSGVTSAVVYDNPTYQCAIDKGLDYVDHDFANVTSSDSSLCCSICSEIDKCKAYTWSNYQGGTCWLKTEKGSTVPNTAVVSGVASK